MSGPAVRQPVRRDVVAWLLWDSGSSGLSAIVGTFVFSVYLVNAVGQDLPGATSAASWLGRTLTIAGFTVAAVAPRSGCGYKTPVAAGSR